MRRAPQRTVHTDEIGDTTMKRMFIPALAVGFAIAAPAGIAIAQKETATGVEVEKDIALLRKNLRSEKKKLIALNLPLTETEATKFWPVYDEYALAMSKHYDEFYALIKEYASIQKTITDSQAVSLIKRWSEIQVELAQERLRWIPRIEKVIPGKKAALFFQVDRRLYALIDMQVTSELPLIIQ